MPKLKIGQIITAVFLVLCGTCFSQENTAILCSDGIDNDGDGLEDCMDAECFNLSVSNGCGICGSGISFADTLLEYIGGCPVMDPFPEGAVGASDYDGIPLEGPRFVILGEGGILKLGFTNNLLTNSGDAQLDVWIFEIGPLVETCDIALRPANAYTESQMLLHTSDPNSDGFYEVGNIVGATSALDIDIVFPGYDFGDLKFDAIEIRDIDDRPCRGTTPGADIDAVCALSSCPICIPDTSLVLDLTCDPNLVDSFCVTEIGSDGCDSIICTYISYEAADTIFYSENTCDLNLIGQDIENFACDSVVVSNYLYLPIDSSYFYDTTCDPAQTDSSCQTFLTSEGCDSIVCTFIDFAAADSIRYFENTCDSSEIATYFQVYDCDSIVITETVFLAPVIFQYNDTTCRLDQAGIDSIDYGCDSTVITNYAFIPLDTTKLSSLRICDGQSTMIFGQELNQEGEYCQTSLTANGCDSISCVELSIMPAPVIQVLPLIDTIVLGESIELNVDVLQGFVDRLNWSPGQSLDCGDCFKVNASPERSTDYLIIGSNENGCQTQAIATIIVIEDRGSIYVPNTFSPNADLNNDFFTIYASPGAIFIERLYIYDRWGNNVFINTQFEPNIPSLGWDGTYKEEDMNPAVFGWFAEVTWFYGKKEILHGDVTLMR